MTTIKRSWLHSSIRAVVLLAIAFASAFCVVIGYLMIQEKFFSEKAYLSKAQKAEQNYFLLARGSLSHNKICGAASDALKYYKKANDAEKIKLFEYIIIDDKCL